MHAAAAPGATLWFVGVTTARSSIMRVFPRWAAHLGIDASVRGVDLAPHAPASAYREVVSALAADPLARGALVTTHKLDLFAACRDLFAEIGPHAALLDEASCLSKPGGRLRAEALDPLTAGLALDAILPPRHFAATGAEAFVMGAGGASVAIACHLAGPARGADRPARVTVSDVDPRRLAHLQAVHRRVGADVPLRPRLVDGPAGNDALLAALPPGSLVVNATGLGKDAPGSPLAGGAPFPERAIAWELNYRGALDFLAQARAARDARALSVHDGWGYFVHGWAQVIAEVFAVPVPTAGPGFDALSGLAAEASGRADGGAPDDRPA